MTSNIWVLLNSGEQDLLNAALSSFSCAEGARDKAKSLMRKIERAGPLPETVLRVEGGFVEVENNPNRVRVFDYDCEGVGEKMLLPDEAGRVCILSEYGPARQRA
jgi:hypothetical protein